MCWRASILRPLKSSSMSSPSSRMRGTVTDKVQEVTEKGAAAIAAIDSAVQAVKDKAESASSELPSTGTTDIGTTEDTTGEPRPRRPL